MFFVLLAINVCAATHRPASLSERTYLVIELFIFLPFPVDILGLLKWASNKENLENSLIKLINIVNAEEVVKYLQDILDALFNILVQNDDPPKFDNLVFKCLLRLIETVSDMKYQHFQSVLDLYINRIFSATLAYE